MYGARYLGQHCFLPDERTVLVAKEGEFAAWNVRRGEGADHREEKVAVVFREPHRHGRLAKREPPKPSEGGGQRDSTLEPDGHTALKPA